MNRKTRIVGEMTAAELAGRLEGEDDSQARMREGGARASVSHGLLGNVSRRVAFCASLLTALVTLESKAHADFPPGTTPASAYNAGYNYGQAIAANPGVLGPSGDYYSHSGNQALDDAFNNGLTDGLEGLAADPPGDPGDPGDCATCGDCASCSPGCASCGGGGCGGCG
jgi:hypothetical protein